MPQVVGRSEVADLGQIFCPACGASVTPTGGACQSCGQILEPGAARPAGPPANAGIGEPSAKIPPRLLADLFAETFRLYRGYFWLFFPIALVPQIPSLIGLATLSPVQEVLLAFVVFVLTVVAQGAVVHSVAAIYGGHPASVQASYRRSIGVSAPLVVGQFLLLAASVGLVVIIIGIPVAFFLLVLFGFFPQATIIERRAFAPAFGRSARLVQGSWWRIFGIGIAYVLVYAAPLGVLAVLTSTLFLDSSTAATLGLALVAAVGMPWILIGATLLYFDLRVRKEGFTLETLAGEIQDRGSP